jgi:hypothetical protein
MDESKDPPCSDKLQKVVLSNVKPPCDRTQEHYDHTLLILRWSSSVDHTDHHPEEILLCEIPYNEQQSAIKYQWTENTKNIP